MNNNTQLSFSGRIRSIKCALEGIQIMILSQHNAWIHSIATILVLIFGIHFNLTNAEWCWLILAVMSVWTAEALNTAFEYLTDVASPSFHPLAAKAKDVSAGAVLITAVGSTAIGFLIFSPHLLRQIDNFQLLKP